MEKVTPTFSTVGLCDGVSLPHLSAISIDDVIRSTRQLLDKSSAADLLPTYIFKQVIDLLAPFVTQLFNRSLAAAWIPSFQGSIHHAGVEETGNLWQSYKQERDCLMHFLRLLAVLARRAKCMRQPRSCL